MGKKKKEKKEKQERYEFVWGVLSYDSLTSGAPNIDTTNDIDIIFDRKKRQYILSIETAYVCKDGIKGEARYLRGLLDMFTKYMDEKGFDKNEEYGIFMISPKIDLKAATIPQLYTQFRIFVEGFCALYDKPDELL